MSAPANAPSLPPLSTSVDEQRAMLRSMLDSMPISRTVLHNCISLVQREQVGLLKYGQALPDAGLSRRELLQHMREEALDFANYAAEEIHAQDCTVRFYNDLCMRLDSLKQRLEKHDFILADFVTEMYSEHCIAMGIETS